MNEYRDNYQEHGDAPEAPQNSGQGNYGWHGSDEQNQSQDGWHGSDGQNQMQNGWHGPEGQNQPQNGWHGPEGQNQQPQNGWQNNQNWQNNPYNQPPRKQKNGLALASMLLGIFSLINCCVPFFQFPLAALAIVLAVISKKGRPFHGFAIAGLVIGIISVLISIGMTFYWGLVLEMMQDPEFMEIYDEIMKTYMTPVE